MEARLRKTVADEIQCQDLCRNIVDPKTKCNEADEADGGQKGVPGWEHDR